MVDGGGGGDVIRASSSWKGISNIAGDCLVAWHISASCELVGLAQGV
jgi:hypothetical protein